MRVRKKEACENKRPRKKKTTDQGNWLLGDGFIPSTKSQNGIFWMVHWWVWLTQAPFSIFMFIFNLKSSNKIMKLFPLCYCYHNYNPQGTWVPFVLRNYVFCFSTPVCFALCWLKKFFFGLRNLGPFVPGNSSHVGNFLVNFKRTHVSMKKWHMSSYGET
jgi:hypothetical protein